MKMVSTYYFQKQLTLSIPAFQLFLLQEMKTQFTNSKSSENKSKKAIGKKQKSKKAVCLEIIDEEPEIQEIVEYPQVEEIIEEQILANKQVPANLPSQVEKEVNDQLRVVRINHFFKREEQIFFEVMVGRAGNVFREPQLLTYEALLKSQYKQMLFDYLLRLFQSQSGSYIQ